MCCLNLCKPIVKECKDKCNTLFKGHRDSYNLCTSNCNDMELSCDRTCRLGGEWGYKNPYVYCASEKGCGKNWEEFDRKCLKNNEQAIMNCCERNCIPTSEIDCTSHCKGSRDHAMFTDFLIPKRPVQGGAPIADLRITDNGKRNTTLNISIVTILSIGIAVAITVLVLAIRK